MAGAVRIEFQVGGVRDVQAAFRTVQDTVVGLGKTREKTAKQSATAEQREAERSAKERQRIEERAMREISRNAERSAREREKAYQKGLDNERKAAEKNFRESQRLDDATLRSKERSLAYVARLKDRYFMQEQRAAERAAASAQRSREQFQRAVAGAAVRGIGGGVSNAARLGMSAAGALMQVGGGFSIADSVNQTIKNRGKAADIVNSGFMPGKEGAAGVRQSVDAVAGEARNTGIQYGLKQENVLEGLEAFTSKTGDLQRGREVMGSLAEIARATGSDFKDLADAAGDVFNADKTASAKDIAERMRFIAAQGKEGAVEIRDLATQMAKLGAASSLYGGNKGTNLAAMGALAQMARARGGAASATQAATSVMGFTTGFDKAAREGAFHKFGVKTRDEKGMLRSPIEIIKESLIAASDSKRGGMQSLDTNLGSMFADASAKRSVRGFEAVYKEAGGGQKGLAAVQKAYDELAKVSMDEAMTKMAAGERMKESDAQIAQTQEIFHKAVEKDLIPAVTRLIPHIVKLAPDFERLLKSVAGMIDFANANPFEAAVAGLGLSITASITKEIAAAGLREALARATTQSLANAGSAGLVVGTLIASVALTKMWVDHVINEKAKEQGSTAILGADAGIAAASLQRRAHAGLATPKELAEAKELQAKTEKDLARQKEEMDPLKRGFGDQILRGVATGIAGGKEGEEAAAFEDKQRAKQMQETAASLAALNSAIQAAERSTAAFAAAANRNGPMSDEKRGGAKQ